MASEAIGTEEYRLARACKQFLDLGRVVWLREQGYEVDTVEYVHETVSRENRIFLAVPPVDDVA